MWARQFDRASYMFTPVSQLFLSNGSSNFHQIYIKWFIYLRSTPGWHLPVTLSFVVVTISNKYIKINTEFSSSAIVAEVSPPKSRRAPAYESWARHSTKP